MAGDITAFTIHVDDAVLSDLEGRLERLRWPGQPDDAAWQYGANLAYMRKLMAYWRDDFNWRQAEAGLNRWPQFRAPVASPDGDNLELHFIHEKSDYAAAPALMIVHGWPGSFYEFLEVIEPLAHPERFGGRIEDGFHIVAPSLPGYGFSDSPKRPMSPKTMAALLNRLMVDVLGYERYFAQGGDWGSIISGWAALEFPENVAAVHFNMLPMRPHLGEGTAPLSDAEKAWIKTVTSQRPYIAAYQEIQSTKGQTLAYGLTDSPLGLAAWIVEKFHGWTDPEAAEPGFTMDQLLTNVMIYWVTGSINSSTWIYRAARQEKSFEQPAGGGFRQPAGFCLPPNDLLPVPPESWLHRLGNVTSISHLDKGGHFTALEVGPDLVDDIRRFFTTVGEG